MEAIHQAGFIMMAIGSIFSPCTEVDPACVSDDPSPLPVTLHEFVGQLGAPGTDNDLRALVGQRNKPDAWAFSISLGTALRLGNWADVTDLVCRYAGWTAHAAGHAGKVEVYAVPIVDAVARFVAVPVAAPVQTAEAQERLRNVGLAH